MVEHSGISYYKQKKNMNESLRKESQCIERVKEKERNWCIHEKVFCIQRTETRALFLKLQVCVCVCVHVWRSWEGRMLKAETQWKGIRWKILYIIMVGLVFNNSKRPLKAFNQENGVIRFTFWERWNDICLPTLPGPLPPRAPFAASAAKSLQSCPTLCDPRDGSPPGSPVPGILQARTLEWVAISFSTSSVMLLLLLLRRFSRVQLCATP